VNATTHGPRITAEHIAAIMEALQCAAAAESPGPLTKAGLSSLTGLSGRVIEATVEAIRRYSIALIASSSAPPAGYWLPATLAEAEENIERRYQRALTQMGTIGGERTLIRRLRDAEALETWRHVFAAVAS
jgi:hypothetical protein